VSESWRAGGAGNTPQRYLLATMPEMKKHIGVDNSDVIHEYDFASKPGPYMERESWLQSQEEKGDVFVANGAMVTISEALHPFFIVIFVIKYYSPTPM
jgi:hypothetical protein